MARNPFRAVISSEPDYASIPGYLICYMSCFLQASIRDDLWIWVPNSKELWAPNALDFVRGPEKAQIACSPFLAAISSEANYIEAYLVFI